jgi:hypothetical protein
MFSVHRAYFIKPDTCELFSGAARILLELGPERYPNSSRGYTFGWTMGRIVNDLRGREFHRGKKPPQRRFPFSNPSIMPDLKRWTVEVHSSMVLMLSVRAVTAKPKLSKAKEIEINQIVHSFYADLVPSCGRLTATHAVSFLGQLGLAPAFVLKFCEMEPNKKVVAFLNGILQKEGRKKLGKNELPRFLDKLCHRLSNANPNLNATHTLVNNILCKFFRKYGENASDGRWADTHSHKQPLFKVVQDGAWIYDGKDTQPHSSLSPL